MLLAEAKSKPTQTHTIFKTMSFSVRKLKIVQLVGIMSAINMYLLLSNQYQLVIFPSEKCLDIFSVILR